MTMYVRFNTYIDTADGRLLGIFKVAQYVSDQYLPNESDDDRLWELFTWFSDNLPLPAKHWRGKNHRNQPTAVAWFKDSALEHIAKAREITSISKRYGVIIDFMRTEKPGYMLYEDEFQVFAEPFKN